MPLSGGRYGSGSGGSDRHDPAMNALSVEIAVRSVAYGTVLSARSSWNKVGRRRFIDPMLSDPIMDLLIDAFEEGRSDVGLPWPTNTRSLDFNAPALREAWLDGQSVMLDDRLAARWLIN